jgi:hypothetical protein
MRADETSARHDRGDLCYTYDLTDEEWEEGFRVNGSKRSMASDPAGTGGSSISQSMPTAMRVSRWNLPPTMSAT